MRARAVVPALVIAAGMSLSACGGGSHGSADPAPTTPVPTTPAGVAPLAAPSSAPPVGAQLTAQQVADDGLPSTVGHGKLPTATVKRLMQFFEDKVSHAYADGDANELDHYLAGPMLSGNRATINLLGSKNKRNLFAIHVASVKLLANQKHRIAFDMTGDMTANYFINAQTGGVLEHGLPGPSQVKFLIFLDQNPATHTWYWTGEQSQSAADAPNTGAGGTVTGQ